MKKIGLAVLLALLLVVGLLDSAFADARKYVWTYEYQTMPKGRSEVEFYETIKVPDKSNDGTKTFEQWIEYEYGVTNHFDLAMYQMCKTSDKNSKVGTKYDGTKLRARYRFGEKNRYWVDPLFYAEFKISPVPSAPDELELKAVLAKDIGKFNFAYNQIVSRPAERRGAVDNSYAAALSYMFKHRYSIGIESKGSYRAQKYYLGPTFSARFQKRWFTTAGLALKVSRPGDDVQLRVIAGYIF